MKSPWSCISKVMRLNLAWWITTREAWAGIYHAETDELLAEVKVLWIDVPKQPFDAAKLNGLGWKVFPE